MLCSTALELVSEQWEILTDEQKNDIKMIFSMYLMSYAQETKLQLLTRLQMREFSCKFKAEQHFADYVP